jgi:Fungal chitosanase of glycosyl hydrolase group 75
MRGPASFVLGLLVTACSSGSPIGPDDAGQDASLDATSDAGAAKDAAAPDASADAPADAGDLLAKLQALTASCNQVSNGLFALGSGQTPTVPICGLTGAVFWKADMDIDCDGKTTTQCNINTDPWYQNQTAATDSQGNPLDAANLPYTVVPGKSTRFDYAQAGLKLGSVILVVYQGKAEYTVFGDIGPTSIIGEASYATASDLGIDPNPSTGGVGGGVLYVAFTGPSAVASPIEDHAGTVTLGQSLLTTLVGP